MLIFCQGRLIGKNTNDGRETKDPVGDADQTKVKQYMVDLTNPGRDAEKDLKVTPDQGQPLCQVDEASKLLDPQLSVMSVDAGSVEDENEKVCGPGFHIGEHVPDLSPFILNYEHTVTLP